MSGLLVATRDGLVLSGETEGFENESVAAMAAAAIALATQFTGQANIGESRAAMFEGECGHVCVFPVDVSLLLVVVGERDITMGMFNVVAKQALSHLHQAVLRQRIHAVRNTRRMYFEQPTTDGPSDIDGH